MNHTADNRFRVQRSLATVHGEEIAALHMDMMPNFDPAQLVTRSDLDAAIVLLRRDMDHEFTAVRSEMRVAFADQGKVLSEQISRSVSQIMRWSVVTMISLQAVMVAAIRLL